MAEELKLLLKKVAFLHVQCQPGLGKFMENSIKVLECVALMSLNR